MLHAPKTPRWLTPELVTLVAFVATATCVAAGLMGAAPDAPMEARPMAVGLAATAIAGAILVRIASARSEHAAASDVRALLMTILGGTALWALVFAVSGDRAWTGCALGATIGLVPSVVMGIVLALFGRTLRSVHMFAANDALERVGLVAGGASGLAGAIAIGFAARALLVIPAVSVALGLGLLATTWRRDTRRVAWLSDVYAGKAKGYKVVPLDEAHAHDETLAPLVPGSAVDAVLLEDASQGPGPYRGGDRPRPVALVQREAEPSLWPIRARAQRAGFFFAMTAALACAASFAQVTRARASSAHEAAKTAQGPRIACYEARAAFEYHAKEMGPVARALMLTPAQDPTIPVGEARLFLADAKGELPAPNVIARVLAAEEQLPCEGRPRLVVLAPTPRPFKLEVRITPEKGEDPAMVARWVREAVTAAFVPGETSAHESVQLGFYDRRVRWRVAAAVAQTTGVRGSEILIDGGKGDIVLAPAELARVDELTVVPAVQPSAF